MVTDAPNPGYHVESCTEDQHKPLRQKGNYQLLIVYILIQLVELISISQTVVMLFSTLIQTGTALLVCPTNGHLSGTCLWSIRACMMTSPSLKF